MLTSESMSSPSGKTFAKKYSPAFERKAVMSEALLIEHCSPTLAGIKTANLFSCPFRGDSEIFAFVRTVNRLLNGKGLRILPLRKTAGHVLFYVFRPALLKRDLGQEDAAALLRERGYSPENPDRCIARLAKRLKESEAFPHEIGLFLGYPPEDVRGFIENGPRSCKLSGCWKVYGDAEAARKQFERFSKCRRIYRSLLGKGRTVENLTVRT